MLEKFSSIERLKLHFWIMVIISKTRLMKCWKILILSLIRTMYIIINVSCVLLFSIIYYTLATKILNDKNICVTLDFSK